jgi:Uma2 family endonuclease
MAPAPSAKHQAAVRNLAFLLMLFLREKPLGKIYFAPIDVLLPGGLATPVQPDLVFLSTEHAHRVREQLIDGAPDLIVEVLSKSNWEQDRRTKLAIYAEAGVREYWIADPREQTVETFSLRDGVYELTGRFGSGEEVRSSAALAGFAPAIDEIFAD